MKIGQIGVALSTKELYLAQDLRFIAILSEAAIVVLDIAGGDDHPVRDLEKISVIATLGASNP